MSTSTLKEPGIVKLSPSKIVIERTALPEYGNDHSCVSAMVPIITTVGVELTTDLYAVPANKTFMLSSVNVSCGEAEFIDRVYLSTKSGLVYTSFAGAYFKQQKEFLFPTPFEITTGISLAVILESAGIEELKSYIVSYTGYIHYRRK